MREKISCHYVFLKKYKKNNGGQQNRFRQEAADRLQGGTEGIAHISVRKAEMSGYFLCGHTFFPAQLVNGPALGRHDLQCMFYGLLYFLDGDGVERLVEAGAILLEVVQLVVVQRGFAEMLQTFMDSDFPEPGARMLYVFQPVSVQPQLDENLLHHFLLCRLVMQHAQGDQ